MKKSIIFLGLLYVSNQAMAFEIDMPVHNHTKSPIVVTVHGIGTIETTAMNLDGQFGFDKLEKLELDMSSEQGLADYPAAREAHILQVSALTTIGKPSLDGECKVGAESMDGKLLLKYENNYVNDDLSGFDNKYSVGLWNLIELKIEMDGNEYDFSELLNKEIKYPFQIIDLSKVLHVKPYFIGSKETNHLEVCFEDACKIVGLKNT